VAGTIVGMQQPTFDVLGFLHEPGHPASVGHPEPTVFVPA
jgi:hypothetical protein